MRLSVQPQPGVVQTAESGSWRISTRARWGALWLLAAFAVRQQVFRLFERRAAFNAQMAQVFVAGFDHIGQLQCGCQQ
jgi:hypothetical protein